MVYWEINYIDICCFFYSLVMMYSEILDFHNVDNVDTSQFLGTPITGDLSALSC